MLGVSGMPVLDAVGKSRDLGDCPNNKGSSLILSVCLIDTIQFPFWMAVDAIMFQILAAFPM